MARPRRKPPWLYDGPLTDRVRLVGCRRCRRAVYEALAGDVLATQVDPVLLTPRAELQLLLTGGLTYGLWPENPLTGVRHLVIRTVTEIRAHPGRGVPLHDCARHHGPADPRVLPPRHLTAGAWSDDPAF